MREIVINMNHVKKLIKDKYSKEIYKDWRVEAEEEIHKKYKSTMKTLKLAELDQTYFLWEEERDIYHVHYTDGSYEELDPEDDNIIFIR